MRRHYSSVSMMRAFYQKLSTELLQKRLRELGLEEALPNLTEPERQIRRQILYVLSERTVATVAAQR